MQPTPHGPSLVGAIVCFGLAAGLAIVSVLFVVQAVGEYGASEGAGAVAGQSLPLRHCRVGGRRDARLAGIPPPQEGPVRAILAAAARTDQET